MFPALNNGSHCFFAHRNAAWPLPCSVVGSQGFLWPIPPSWAQHLLTGQLGGLTENRLVRLREWVHAFAYARSPWGYTRNVVCVCLSQVSVWCVFYQLPTQMERLGQDTQVVLRMNSAALSVGTYKLRQASTTGAAEVWDKGETETRWRNLRKLHGRRCLSCEAEVKRSRERRRSDLSLIRIKWRRHKGNTWVLRVSQGHPNRWVASIGTSTTVTTHTY